MQKAHSIGDLVSALQTFMTPGYRWLFRGHGSTDWKLIPKAGRITWPANDNDLTYFAAWRRRAIPLISIEPASDLEWLALAQHHGLATRLLDWTMSPLTAAFFAVADDSETDAVIHAFQPTAYISDDTPLMRFEGIGVYRPRVISSRITTQLGLFTLHSPPELEFSASPSTMMVSQITIAGSSKLRLLQELDYLGVNRFSLFPDLDGLSDYYNWYAQHGYSITRREERPPASA